MLKDYIYKRKSIRNYETEKLSSSELMEVETVINNLTPLFKDIKYQIVITDQVGGLFKVNAPQYFWFYSEDKSGYLENIGFLGQQLSLKLNELNLGSCWLGMVKPKKIEGMLSVISMAFGKAKEELFRKDKTEFLRKPLSAIANIENEYTEAVRLAPSAINAQDWYFHQDKDLIHCYRKAADFPQRVMLGKMSNIDMGIAVYYLTLFCDKYQLINIPHPTIEACEYFVTLKMLKDRN